MTHAPDFSGWAVSVADVIDMRTVSGTRRAAIVNWLYVEAMQFIGRSMCDERIEDLWAVNSVRLGATVVEVFVSRSPNPAAESVAALVKMLRTVRVGIEMGRIEDQNLRDPISAKATEITYTALSKLIDAALAPFGEG